MNRRSSAKRGLVLAVVFGVVCAMTPFMAGAPAEALPGTPGTPQDPTGINEDFQTQVGAGNGNVALPIQVYTHLDVATGTQMPYSADPAWTAPVPGQNGKDNCNGWVLNYYSPTAGGNCGSQTNANGGRAYTNRAATTFVGQSAWWFLKGMAVVIGAANGMADPRLNNVVASQTTTDPQAAGYQFKADNVVKTQAGHYYAVAVDFAEAHCPNSPGGLPGWFDARESLALVVDGTPKWMFGDGTAGGGVSICDKGTLMYVPQTGPGSAAPSDSLKVDANTNTATQNTNSWLNTPYYFMHMVSNPVQTATPQNLGLQVYNARAQFTGNDVAFDNIEIVDVTPQMDKAFTPGTISAGQTATLTFTMTNTTDLHKKDGWHFTDTLQPGLVAVPGSAQIHGCDDPSFAGPATDGGPGGPNGKVTISPDGTTIDVQGNLAEGVSSCYVTVEVTSTKPGTYSNGCAEISNLWGLNPPAIPVDPQDPTVCEPPDGPSITVDTHPHLTLTKTASSTTTKGGLPSVTVAGQKVTYTITITNDGDVPVSDLVLDDSVFNGKGTLNNDLSCTDSKGGSVAARLPGDPVGTGGTLDPLNSVGNQTYTGPTSTTCTVSYNATQQDIDSASTKPNIDNTAVASGIGLGTGPGDTNYPIESDPKSATVVVDPTPPGLVLEKTVVITDEDGDVDTHLDNDGDNLTYTFKVTNTGVTTISNLTINDGSADSYKGVSQVGFSGLGTLSAVQCPTDASAWMSGVVRQLRPNDWIECTATYLVLTEDFNHSGVYNTAQASGTDPGGGAVTSNFAHAPAVVDQTPALTIVKVHNASLGPAFVDPTTPDGIITYDPDGTPHIQIPQNTLLPGKAGDVVRFYFLVTNTGNTELTEVGVTDSMNGIESPIECPEGRKGGLSQDGKITLMPGEWVICSADYVLKQTDVDSGSAINLTAQAHGTETTNTVDETTGEETITTTPVFSNIATNTVLLAAGPALSLKKCEMLPADSMTPDGQCPTLPAGSITAAGQQVKYSFYIENTGNVTLSNLTLTDPAPYTYDTVAGFSGTGVWNWTTPAICPSTSLAAGASEICTASYTVTQGDVDLGYVKNTATVTGQAPPGSIDDQGNPVTSVTSDPSHVEFDITPNPQLTLTKTASPTTVTTTPTTVTYSFKVQNTGNVTMNNLSFQDGTANSYTDTTHPGFSGTNSMSAVTCPTAVASWPSGVVGSLRPNDIITCTATYTVSQADIDAGVINNTATVTGDDPNGTPKMSDPSPAQVNVTQNPSLYLDKYATETTITAANQVIHYKFDVTNNGNVTMTDVHVTDNVWGGSNPLGPVNCPTANSAWTSGEAGTLKPGESIQCWANYTVTQADVDAGHLYNAAFATGTDPIGHDKDSPPSDDDIGVVKTASLLLNKSVTPNDTLTVDDLLTYSFEVTNTGNVTLTNLHINDAGPYTNNTTPGFNGSGGALVITCPTAATAWPSGFVGTLRPGDTITCTAPYTVTLADVNRGTLNNAAVATADDPDAVVVTSNPDHAVVPATQEPAITVTKTDSASGSISNPVAGMTVTYYYLVKNTGNVTLANVTPNDTMPGLSTISCPATWPSGVSKQLNPNQSVTCSATYVLQQSDINSGALHNTVTVTGDPPTGGPVDDTDTDDVTLTQNPHLTLDKTAVVSSADHTMISATTDTVTYSFKVTNDGNVTITNIKIDDTSYTFSGTGTFSAASISCDKTTLLPGEYATCTAPAYTVTQPDLNSTALTNTAKATGKDPGNQPVTSNQDSVTIDTDQNPHLTLDKTATVVSADNTKISATTNTVTYHFTVTNDGNVTITNIKIDDTSYTFSGTGTFSAAGITCDKTILSPGESAECTSLPYTVTQADLNSTALTNTAKATGKDPENLPVTSNQDSVTIDTDQNPHLTLDKTAVVSSADDTMISATTDTVTYSFKVTNDGNVTITNIKIDDTSYTFSGTGTFAATSITCDKTTLQPGEFASCSAPAYTVTQADLNSTALTNTAKATGKDPGNQPVVSNTDTVTIDTDQNPHLTLDKTAVVSSADDTMISATTDTVTYSFKVTNDGNVTVSNIKIDDTSYTFSGTGSFSAASISCDKTTLLPGEYATCTAPAYTVTQADLNSTALTNTAKATGKDPGNQPVVSNTDTVTIDTDQNPHLTLQKSVTPTSVSLANTPVTYSFAVKNEGNVTVTNIAIDEASYSFSGTGTFDVTAISCDKTTLLPGETATCTSDPYLVTQTDIDSGSILNTAKATGKDPTDAPVVSNPSPATVDVTEGPSLAIAKSATPMTVTAAGQTVKYTFVVTNNGNLTVKSIKIEETAFSGTGTIDWTLITCDKTTLAPTETANCTAPDYVVTQADIDAGKITNSADATGKDPTNHDVTSPEDSKTVQATQSPALTIDKTATPTTVAAVGDSVVYTFVVTNTGNVTVHNVAINESAFTGTGAFDKTAIICDDTTLAPLATTTCTAPTYYATQADLDATKIDNTANATGNGPATTSNPQGPPVASQPDSQEVTATQSPHLSLEKSASPTTVSTKDQTVVYTFKVTNDGNVTIKDIAIDEASFTFNGHGTFNRAGITCDDTVLAPGATTYCHSQPYTATQADIDAGGTIDNTATATGTTDGGEDVASDPDTAHVTVDGNAALTLVKTANPSVAMPAKNGTITYSFLVTNTGTQTVKNLTVTDTDFNGVGAPLGAPTCPKTTLLPGESTTCTVSYIVQQGDIDNGELDNTAHTTGKDPQGGDVISNDDSTQVPSAQSPSLELIKSATPTTVSVAGQTVDYLFQVKNDGNVTINTITIDETSFTGTNGPLDITCPTTPLGPGETFNCTATYTITQEDIDAGVVLNTAIATGKSPTNQKVDSNSDNAIVTAAQDPALDLLKTALPTTVTAAGQTINYSYLVTNIGNVTVNNITIDESSFTGLGTVDPAGIVCDDTSLAPLASTTCHIAYVVVQADIDAGGPIDNTASAVGKDPTGEEVDSTPSSASVDVTQSPSLTLVKSAAPAAGGTTINNAGDVINYTFTVTNDGNVTVKGITIADNGPYAVGGTAVGFSGVGTMSAITCPVTTLAPGGSTICHATYTSMQDDIDAGGVYNTAQASGTTDTAGPVASNLSTAQVPSNKAPALEITKTHDAPPTRPMAGDTVTFRYTVTNNGNTTINNVIVSDVLTGHGMTVVTCGAGASSMAPLAVVQCSAVYTLAQADIDAGFKDNPTAQASGRAVGATTDTMSNIANDHVPLAQDPVLTLAKSVDPSTVTAPGEVEYSFLVKNEGNVTVTDIAIDETTFTGSNGAPTVTCPVLTLLPGDSTTCKVKYSVSQADIDAGVVNNTATVTGNDPNGDPVTSEPSSATVTATQTPALGLVKTGSPSAKTDLHPGVIVTYSFLVTNTGNVTVTNLSIDETNFTGFNPLTPPTCPTAVSAWASGTVGTLRPGDSVTCTTTYTVTQEDEDEGTFVNTAVAKGVVPLSARNAPNVTDGKVPSNPSTFSEALDTTSTINLVKTGVLDGNTIKWTFEVTNTGVTDEEDILVVEQTFTGKGTTPTITCPKTKLAPLEKMVCTAVYTYVAGDKGTTVSNTAKVTGLGAHRRIPVEWTSTATVKVPADPPVVVHTGGSVGEAAIWPYAVAGALVLIGLGVLGVFLWRRRREDGSPAAKSSTSGQAVETGEAVAAAKPALRGDIGPTV